MFCWTERNAWPELYRFVFQLKNLSSMDILKLKVNVSSSSLSGGRQWGLGGCVCRKSSYKLQN